MPRATILVADNNREFLENRRLFLEKEGYRVVSAHDDTDARRKLEDGGIHIAILDVRLHDNDDEHDRSGLELARRFPRVPKIILTDYASTLTLQEAWRRDEHGKRSIVDFLEKERGAEAMLVAVRLTLGQEQSAATWPLLMALLLLIGMGVLGVLAVWNTSLLYLVGAVGLSVIYMAYTLFLTGRR